LSDVDQARQAELTSRNNYVDAVARYRSSLDQFKIVLGLPLGEKLYLDDEALDELERTGLVPAPLDSETAFRLAVHRQAQALNFIDQFEDSKRKVRLAADQLKPGLKLVSTAAVETGEVDYTRFNANRTEVDVALEFDLPLDRIPRGNTYRNALITFQSSLRQFTARLDNLKSDIESGLRTLEQRRQNYEIQKNALALANRRIASTIMMLEAGRAEVRNLIEAQDAQISAQTAVTSALVSYQDTRLQLMLDIGALNTEQPKFWLADHLAAYLPSGSPVAAQTPSSPGVLTPEESFRN
jgi:outer membrane protein TolC